MSDQDQQEQLPQDDGHEYDEDYGEWSDHDYYDPEDDLAYYHDQRLLIEESWLEWERLTSVNNRQSESTRDFALFQKPGSMKRRERRKRSAQALSNVRDNNRSTAVGGGSTPGSESGAPEADSTGSERQRRLGSYRSEWEEALAARQQRLAARAGLYSTR
jgi:hypothetical protein